MWRGWPGMAGGGGGGGVAGLGRGGRAHKSATSLQLYYKLLATCLQLVYSLLRQGVSWCDDLDSKVLTKFCEPNG